MSVQIKILRLLLCILFTAVDQASAFGSCSSIFHDKIESSNKWVNRIRNFRKNRIYKDEISSLYINNKKYQIYGVLGEGTSRVYLGKDSDGRKVTIKMIYDYSSWLNSIYYEMAATDFYLDMGVPVPRIYEFEIKFDAEKDTQVAMLVKEYREGITRDELAELIDVGPKKWRDAGYLLKELEVERKKMKRLHDKFASWLVKKKINLKSHPFKQLQRLIKEGDMSEDNDNFLYDIQLNRWILYDP